MRWFAASEGKEEARQQCSSQDVTGQAAALEDDAKARRARRLDEIAKHLESNVSALTAGLSTAAMRMEATAEQTSHVKAA